MAAALASELVGAQMGYGALRAPGNGHTGVLPPDRLGMGGRSAGRVALLSQVGFLAPLGEKERRALAEASHVRTFKSGEALFYEGDPSHTLYVVQSGRVKSVLVAPDGRESIVQIHGPGECLGELSLIDGGARPATAIALDRVEVLVLYQEELLALLDRCPKMALAVMRRLAEMIRRLNRQLQDVLSLDLTARVAKTLLELAEAHGEPAPQGIRIALRLTQQELAQMVGAARGRVNMCLRAFQQRGILWVEREQITLLKPQELQRRIY
jgi:CRP/FNR family cyclic AMP-dependent transcriptional regulator